MAMKAAVILAEGFEEIEAVTPIDTLRRAGVDVMVASLKAAGPVTGAHGIRVMADLALDSLPAGIDAIILPGGMPGAENLAGSKRLIELIQDMHRAGKIVAAICASPALVLTRAGVLKGRSATCFPGMEGEFGKDVRFKEDSVVIDGNIITSRGPGTALAFACAIVERLSGKEKAEGLRGSMLANYGRTDA